MSLRIDIGWLVATLLISVRVATATMFAPVLGPTQVPATARVVFVIALSAFFAAGVATSMGESLSLVQLAVAVLTEAVIGLAFAFGFMVAYGAAHFAGRALDIQMGFGAAAILNPTTQTPAPLVGSVFGMLLVAAFLAMNGHLVLIKALAASVEVTPPGAMLTGLDPAAVLAHSASVFAFGLAFAAPVMFMLLLSDVALAIAARSMPQLNVFVLGFAIKITLGLIGLAISIRFADGVLNGLFGVTFAFWEGLVPRG